MSQSEAHDKPHASWVELYFDLVFVFAVSQLTHLIVAIPARHTVLLALGLFTMLWWTWIGFVVHYNRYGQDRPAERLVLLGATVPTAVAAIEVHDAGVGHLAGFALALAGTRLILAGAHWWVDEPGVRLRIGSAYLLSAAALAVSAALPPVWQFLAWAAIVVLEATALLLAGTERSSRRPRDGTSEFRGFAVNPRHLAERFNLFMIIVLGEVVISVSAAASGGHDHQTGYWVGLLAGLVLAGAAWWIYFSSAAGLNEALLHASGGSPALAYGIYASGYLVPTFALVLLAAGCALALQEAPPAEATWYVTLGLAIYLAGVRGFELGRRGARRHLLRVLVLAVTISIALLNLLLTGEAVVAVSAIWAVLVAVGTSRRLPSSPAA